MCCQYDHVLSAVFSGLVRCLEICTGTFIPFRYSNSSNMVDLVTSRVKVDCRGILNDNSDLLELFDGDD